MFESFPIMTAPPLNGGSAFAGKSGRSTPNACETKHDGNEYDRCCTFHVRRSYQNLTAWQKFLCNRGNYIDAELSFGSRRSELGERCRCSAVRNAETTIKK